MKYSDAGSYDHTKDLNLPSLPSVSYNSKHREALVFGTVKSTERESKFKSDAKIEATEDIKCKALTGDCNCQKCYDSSGFYWGWNPASVSNCQIVFIKYPKGLQWSSKYNNWTDKVLDWAKGIWSDLF